MSVSHQPPHPSQLEFVERDGRAMLRIENVNRMAPFLMSVLSDTDLWMFVASNGGLTAGRVSSDQSLFPYETVDRLYERPGLGGPFTLIRTEEGELWRPFATFGVDDAVQRSLLKSELGDRVVLEEEHRGLGLRFSYAWSPSERFGWVRTASLSTLAGVPRTVEVLDGLLDLLPAGVQLASQQRTSNLIDAYRHTELHSGPGDLAAYSLSSLLTDRAEPAEALRANVVWRCGLPGVTHLTADAVEAWRRGTPRPQSHHARGRKGAYLVEARVDLEPSKPREWMIVGDVALDHPRMAVLRRDLAASDLAGQLADSLEETHHGIARLAASVDGWQRTGEKVVDANHLANSVFNGLRGGVFVDDGRVPRQEIAAVVRARNAAVSERHAVWMAALPDAIDVATLRAEAADVGDPNLARLVDEVLPLAFGRRHGDPSRPWNRFEIRTRTDRGDRALHYEGNWRDIFQNWEALTIGYPEYLPSIIAKFVSASTVDGFNPYRISRNGIDWEVPDPDDPWSNIGYWGDHQVIYLLRLLEALERYRPELLEEMLDSPRFAFGDVPYRLVPYTEILSNPRDTIRFDEAAEARVEARVEQIGHDGRLLHRGSEIVLTHLWEKVLIPLLSKLSNLVLEGGIWMNTQRPEWNDANNALPGYGVSVVTLAHTLRFTRFLQTLAARRSADLTVSPLVGSWFDRVRTALDGAASGSAAVSDADRRSLLDQLGVAFSEYREAAYAAWPTGEVALAKADLEALLARASEVLEHSLRANRRPDGLFHAYNTIEISPAGVGIHRLPLMLEGQVAALDASALSSGEAASLVEAMYRSPLYRPDQDSFLLYPDQVLPDFEAKNRVDEARARSIDVARRWLDAGDARILTLDAGGVVRFHADFSNAEKLEAALDGLDREGEAIPEQARAQLLDLYEVTFHHAEFTGRSRSMYGFEGLGCIYWHMVAKFLVAVQESFHHAVDGGEDTEGLAAAYHRVRGGFGFNKAPEVYGAFPTDAYSHTPGHSGAQQPGMTGQVKEQVITRFGELGVRLRQGRLCFEPRLLRPEELTRAATAWTIPGLDSAGEVQVPAGGLGFMLAGVPVVYRVADGGPAAVRVFRRDGATETEAGAALSAELTRALLGRSGEVARIEVDLPALA